MRRLSERQLKWWLFCLLVPVHVALMWMGLIFNWYLVGLVAMFPVIALESMKLQILTFCYSIVCGPSDIGWLLCLIVWVGFDYVIASMLSKKPWRRSQGA
jgi:hypothetical protein